MANYIPKLEECAACTNRWGNRPPCVKLRNLQPPGPGMMLVGVEMVGAGGEAAQCPFVASWGEVVQFARRLPDRTGIYDDYTYQELHNIRTYLETGRRPPRRTLPTIPDPKGNRDPIYCSFIVGRKGPGDNNHHLYIDDGNRQRVFLRRMQAQDWQKFWDWFQEMGLLTPVGRMELAQKFVAALKLVPPYLLPELRAKFAELLDPVALGLVVGVFLAMMITPAKVAVFISNAFKGFGLLTQLKGYVDDLAGFVLGVADAQSPADLDRAARCFASFCARAVRDGCLAAVLKFLEYLKKRSGAEWRKAADEGEKGGKKDSNNPSKRPPPPAAQPTPSNPGGKAKAPVNTQQSSQKTLTTMRQAKPTGTPPPPEVRRPLVRKPGAKPAVPDAREANPSQGLKRKPGDKPPMPRAAKPPKPTSANVRKSCPIPIPDDAKVDVQNKAGGYDQFKYRWDEGGYKYEARWHTPTPGAPADAGDNWVVSRIRPGTPDGQKRAVQILVGDNQWVPQYEWQAAVSAYQNGTATPEQLALLKAGHHPASVQWP